MSTEKVESPLAWNKQTYERAIASRCWRGTAYCAGWDACAELRADNELREIVELENALGALPSWAVAIVEGAIRWLPYCPHYTFPRPHLEVLDAIGKEQPRAFLHGCYTADADRKERMLDYIFCLDAWLGGTPPVDPARELNRRGHPDTDWMTECASIWRVLGASSRLKRLLLKRTLHRLRWWVKTLTWEGDRGDAYLQDCYLGAIQAKGDFYGTPGAPDDPFSAELHAPRVLELEKQLALECVDWDGFRPMIQQSRLCAPKAFRHLEILLWSIGKERVGVSLPFRPLSHPEAVPSFLNIADTLPDTATMSERLLGLAMGVDSWIEIKAPSGHWQTDVHQRLGRYGKVKAWLARLYLRKLVLIDPFGILSHVSEPAATPREAENQDEHNNETPPNAAIQIEDKAAGS